MSALTEGEKIMLGDFAAIKNSTNGMINQLKNIMIETQSKTDKIAEASFQVRITAHNLAGNTTLMTNNLEGTTAVIEEITTSISQSSDSASSAHKTVLNASKKLYRVVKMLIKPWP